jgi:hypothetical protein
MKNSTLIAQSGIVLALLISLGGCAIEPRNDYYDRDHHRYYHEHVWHDCAQQDEHCR